MIEKRDEIVAALRKKGLRKLSRQILYTVAEMIEQYAAGVEVNPQATNHPAVVAALKAQKRLGWEAFFRGYLVKEWLEAFRATHNTDAMQQFDQFQQMIWFDIAQPQWHARNRVAHGPNSNTNRIESARMAEKLVWYNMHRHELLPAEQKVLAERNLQEILRMRSATRRAWLHHLEIVTEAWEKRKYHRENNQRTLAEFFDLQIPRPPRRRNIAKEANEYADRKVLRREQNQPLIDNIFPRVDRPLRQRNVSSPEDEVVDPRRARQPRQARIDIMFRRQVVNTTT